MEQEVLQEKRSSLLELSRELGREGHSLVILGEGNVSARIDDETLIVKASGSSLATMQESDLVQCKIGPLLPLLEKKEVTDEEMENTLLACRIDATSAKPSIETLFHVYLLGLGGIEFVAHTHPQTVNQILCSPMARDFAEHRLCPDQIVYCGVASAFVPYTDPGLPLARAIREQTESFLKRYRNTPQTILLENHGLITLGRTAQAVLAATLMMEKSARIFVGAASLGGPKFLADENAQRIARRPDEQYRRRWARL